MKEKIQGSDTEESNFHHNRGHKLVSHRSFTRTVDTYGHLVPGGNRQAVDKLDQRVTITEKTEATA